MRALCGSALGACRFRRGSCARFGGRRPDERIEHQHHATFIFAREFADHQMAGARGNFPIHHTGAVRVQIVAQGMQLVAAATKIADHLAAQQRQHFVEMVGGRDGGIHDDFELRIHVARFFEEAEGETRANAEGVLAIRAAMRKGEFHLLTRTAEARDVRKKDGAREDLSGAFFVRADYAQRKRRPRLLFIAQFEFGKHRLLG